MPPPIQHTGESESNAARDTLTRVEPKALRTFTPTQAVIARSAGVFHWTPEGRRLYDFTSGVLVSNLGHNPTRWLRRFGEYMNWPANGFPESTPQGFTPAIAMTAYNAATPVEMQASARLLKLLRGSTGGGRMEQVMWAASGSEAI